MRGRNVLDGYHGGYYGGGSRDGGIITLLAVILLAIFAMPLVGGYLLISGKNDGSKLLGGALLVVGIILLGEVIEEGWMEEMYELMENIQLPEMRRLALKQLRCVEEV